MPSLVGMPDLDEMPNRERRDWLLCAMFASKVYREGPIVARIWEMFQRMQANEPPLTMKENVLLFNQEQSDPQKTFKGGE